MSMISEAFGWMVGVDKKSLADLDVESMEANLRQTAHLRESWEREIKAVDKEYRDAVSLESNAARSPIQRKLSFQRGAILAKKMVTLTSAVNMLYKVSGAVEQLKMLKKFYNDLTESMALPKGLSVAQAIPQIYKIIDGVGAKQDELQRIIDSIPEPPKCSVNDDEIEKMMQDLNKLYEDYNTKVAMNDKAAADKVMLDIEAKKAEMDKQMGLGSLV